MSRVQVEENLGRGGDEKDCHYYRKDSRNASRLGFGFRVLGFRKIISKGGDRGEEEPRGGGGGGDRSR